MIVGKIDWFGGLNNQTQKINNYGFINPIEGENIEKYFVHRNDVSSYLQDFLQENRGVGVYVQFDIETGSKGKQAVNVELVTVVGIIDWFDRGRGYIKCEGRPDVYLTSNDTLYSGDILHFGLQYNSKFRSDEAILVQKVNQSTEEQSMLEKCSRSNNPDIFIKYLVDYAQTLSSEKAITIIVEKIKLLDNDNFYSQESLKYELIRKAENLLLASSELRAFCSANNNDANSYGCFIDKYFDLVDESLRQELLNELIKKLRKGSDLERSIYWNRVKYFQRSLEYKGFLWDIAPAERKKLLIKDRY